MEPGVQRFSEWVGRRGGSAFHIASAGFWGHGHGTYPRCCWRNLPQIIGDPVFEFWARAHPNCCGYASKFNYRLSRKGGYLTHVHIVNCETTLKIECVGFLENHFLSHQGKQFAGHCHHSLFDGVLHLLLQPLGLTVTRCTAVALYSFSGNSDSGGSKKVFKQHTWRFWRFKAKSKATCWFQDVSRQVLRCLHLSCWRHQGACEACARRDHYWNLQGSESCHWFDFVQVQAFRFLYLQRQQQRRKKYHSCLWAAEGEQHLTRTGKTKNKRDIKRLATILRRKMKRARRPPKETWSS